MYWPVLVVVLLSVLHCGEANQNFLNSEACDIFPWETSSWKENAAMDSALQQEKREECFATAYHGNITLLSEPWYLFVLQDGIKAS
jgi:hypothetical protein